jgi:hypothetical protein
VCLPFAQQELPIEQLIDARALSPFDAWKSKPDKIVY